MRFLRSAPAVWMVCLALGVEAFAPSLLVATSSRRPAANGLVGRCKPVHPSSSAARPARPARPAKSARPAVATRLYQSTPTKTDEKAVANAKNETALSVEATQRHETKAGEGTPLEPLMGNLVYDLEPPMSEKSKEGKKSSADSLNKKNKKKPLTDITADFSFLDGQAKVEEPGDREKIMNSIRAYQYEVSKNDPRIPFETIIQRTLDTAEDAWLHARRVPYDLGWVLEEEKEDRQTIVVLGSGWAAHALLKVADTYKLRIIVVSPSNHFVFTPMLASAAVGTVEYRSMTEAVRAANPMIHNFLEGQATNIDVKKQTIKVKMNSLLSELREGDPPVIEVAYDKLIVAVGCKVADTLVPGAFENSMRLKTCDDARRLRTAVGESLEYASRPEVRDDPKLSDSERDLRRQERRKRLTYAIVGGGPTGVELAGELSDFFEDITRPRVGEYPNLRDDIRIVLIQGAKDLVPQFDEDLRGHALKSLRKRGVEVRLNTRVNEVGDGFLKIVPKGEGQEEETVVTGLNVWAAGTEAVPFMKTLLEKLPEETRGPQGKVNVDPWLRCATPEGATFGSIMVMGDAAAFVERENSFLPQTAQVAGQQGAYAARLLDREYDLSVTPPKLKASADGDMMNTWLKLRGLERAEGCKWLCRRYSCGIRSCALWLSHICSLYYTLSQLTF
jgi:NADH dehydrogenase FAD-containing subunit